MISDLMCAARYLGWNNMSAWRIWCSAGGSSIMWERITWFSPWLNTIRYLRESRRVRVKCARAVRLGTRVADITIIGGGDMYALS
jgi:hypothetical protein